MHLKNLLRSLLLFNERSSRADISASKNVFLCSRQRRKELLLTNHFLFGELRGAGSFRPSFSLTVQIIQICFYN